MADGDAKVKWSSSFDLIALQRRRTQLRNDVLIAKEQYNTVLDEAGVSSFIVAVRKVLNLPASSEKALRRTLLEFADQDVTELVGDRITLKLAAVTAQLKKRRSLGVFNGLKQPTWLPLEITEARLSTVRKHKLYVRVSMLVMGGVAVGQEVIQELPYKFVATKMALDLGWPRYSRRPLHQELVQMWLLGQLSVHEHKGLQVGQFHAFPQYVRHNKELMELRESPCIRGYNQICRACPVGYSQCNRGTHRYTWIQRPCKKCKKEKAIFDPGEPGALECAACRSAKFREAWRFERRGLGSS